MFFYYLVDYVEIEEIVFLFFECILLILEVKNYYMFLDCRYLIKGFRIKFRRFMGVIFVIFVVGGI